MKKVIFSLVAIVGLSVAANKVNAQQSIKIGVFDIDQMVQMMPEMKDVQTKISSFQKDTLGPQKDNLDLQLSRADSTYKADSLAKKPQATLDYERTQLQNLFNQYYNWQNIVQQATQNKYAELTQPYYEKVLKAYQKVLTATKVNIVLNPQALERGTDEKMVTNLFLPVAKELGIKLDQNETNAAGGDAGAAPAKTPAKK